MKKLVSCAAIAAMLAATGCSEKEITTEVVTGPDQSELTLGISTGVKATKSIVEGEAIVYKKANYVDQPGMGIVVLNKNGDDFYGKKDPALATSHVWFMGDENGENWQSISAQGTTFAAAVSKAFPLEDEVGRVYAYYPKAENSDLGGSTSTDLTLTAPLRTIGTIAFADAATNADMKYNGSGWISNSSTSKKVLIADVDEVDYLYANNTGRYVNSGRAGEGADAGVVKGNADATNPGREIELTMVHALSMVSFRVHNDGTLPGDGQLTKIVIRNAAGKTAFKSSITSTMNLATGAIRTTGNLATDSITRAITGYIIPKEVKAPETESETTFIKTTSPSGPTGPKVARKISMLVYPIAAIPENEIEVMFTIDGVDYPVVLPVVEAPEWIAGTNYLYTVCASQRKLTVTSVSVTDWDTVSGDDMEL